MDFSRLVPFPLLGANISVGDHFQTKVGPFTLNLDTIWATGVALLVLLVVGFLLRRQATSGVPGKLQLAFETGVTAVTRQIEGSIGPRGLAIVPLAVALFVLILIANFFEMFGIGSTYEWLITPSADVNFTGALAIVVIVLVHAASIRSRGIVGYVKHYATQPFPIYLLPFNIFMNLVEEISKPVTLALRLFGNLFSGALMLALLAALGAWKLGSIPIGDVATLILSVLWKLFDVFLIGPLQAFIFTLLTILYFDTAMQTHAETAPTTTATRAETAPAKTTRAETTAQATQ